MANFSHKVKKRMAENRPEKAAEGPIGTLFALILRKITKIPTFNNFLSFKPAFY